MPVDENCVLQASGPFDVFVETLIIGAGAGGLVAALSAKNAGQEVLVLEADAVPSGSTALSAGLIPTAGTSMQLRAGIDDTAAMFAQDIQNKAHDQNDPDLVTRLATNAAPAIEWLADTFGLPFSVVDNFDYPGHSARRMHGLPSRSGRELVDLLAQTCADQGIDIMCNARVTALYREQDQIMGVRLGRPDGSFEDVGCGRLILACNGFGGSRAKVETHIPDMQDALWFGHSGNQGDALDWGAELGAAMQHLGAYQGHGNVAHPHGILITWATITEGGFQVNQRAERFWDESQGYSEAARAVMQQEGGTAYTIFDARIADVARQFQDFKDAEAAGAILVAHSMDDIASALGLDAVRLTQTWKAIPETGADRFGRDFNGKTLQPPYCAVKVTGALFHTQGGLQTTENAQVVSQTGRVFPNMFAVGGAAVGVSGRADDGYLSGNGLLSAVVLGWLAGRAG